METWTDAAAAQARTEGWCLADTIAGGVEHEYIAPFSLDRFVTGALVDEHGAAGVAH